MSRSPLGDNGGERRVSDNRGSFEAPVSTG